MKQDSLYDISSIQKLDHLVSKFLPQLSSPTIVWLQGPLGIGKSEWVRRSIQKMGYKNPIPSPSFSIHHAYPIQDKWVHHIDLYRVQNESDLESIGFYDLFLETKGCIFIEWADHIQIHNNFPNWNQLRLLFKWEDSKRILSIQQHSKN